MYPRELLGDGARRGEGQVKRLQTKVTVRRTRTMMRSAWDFGRVQLSLTSASSAFFNTGSFFSFSSRCLSVLLRRPILLGDGRVSSPPISPPRRSLSSCSSMAYFACKSNWTGTLPAHTARIFRLLIFAIDQGNTGETRGNLVIGRQPSTLTLPFSLSSPR